jgi:hypothetical protein
MARNRKNQAAAIRFGPALKAFVLCLLIGGSGVGYVWQKNQIYELSQQMKKREITLRTLQGQNEKLRKQLAAMRSPKYLDMKVRELNLGLVQPQPNQIWRLPEPMSDLPRVGQETQFAAQQARSPLLQ